MDVSGGRGGDSGRGAFLCLPQSPILLSFLVLVSIYTNVRVNLIYAQKYAYFLISMLSVSVVLIDMYGIVLFLSLASFSHFSLETSFKVSHVILNTWSLTLLMVPR